MPRPALAALALAAALAAAHGPADARLRVVATTPDLAAIAAEVGGDLVEVTALAASTEDPHYVDPKPSLILPLNKADLLVVNGLDLEVGWLPPLQVAARNAAIQTGGRGYVDASAFVRKLDLPTGPVDRSMGDIHVGGNPHYTHDPRSAAPIARGLAEHLGRLDPAHLAAYRERAERFAAEVEAFVKAEAARFRALPDERRRVVSYHKSLTYLLDWLGLQEVGTIEPLPGVPPSPRQVADVLRTMRERSARLIVQEEYYRRNTSRTLAQMAKADLVLLHGGTRFQEGERYLDHVRHTVGEIYDALAK